MSSLRQRIRRFEAPVDYGEIRPWLQRVRAVAASVVMIAWAIGIIVGVPHAWLPTALAAIVVVHALVRGPMPHPVVEPLVLDAVVIVTSLGISDNADTATVAAVAYLIAASITFGGRWTIVTALAAFAGTMAARPFLPVPGPQALPVAGEVILWLAAAVFLSAVALSLTAAATAVSQSRDQQAAALDSVRKAGEMKNQFVSMVTHELRTPLTNITGFADTLVATWRELPPEDVDEFLQIVVSESDHLKSMVDDVLAIPRLEAGRLLLETTDFQLRPAAFKIANLLFPDGGERRASVSIGGNVIVNADPNRVEQILRNLLENARKYGGDQVSVEAVPVGTDWQIIVADTGPGIPLEERERIFGAFEQVSTGDTRPQGGFGLGLAVVKNLVEAMGGRIWYEPGFPVGARFCFTLPRARTQTGDAPVRSEVA